MTIPAFVRDSRIIRNAMVPMRDGVRLATTVFLPRDEGRYPAALVRIPYNRGHIIDPTYNQNGIALVAQDTRGRYGSEGEFYPFAADADDGEDTLNWIAEQPWSNGKVGMFGDSYLASVQFAVAPGDNPHLAALNPRFMSGDPWQRAYYADGVLSLGLTFTWICLEVGSRSSESMTLPQYDVPALMRHRPVIELDEAYGGSKVNAYRDYLNHSTRDAFWRELDWRSKLGKTHVPILLTAGWYDYYAGETFKNYKALLDGEGSPALKASHRVLVGPWTHGFQWKSQLGDIDFGPQMLQENNSSFRWLNTILKGSDATEFQKAPIRLFVMGINEWRDENEWPLARTRFTPYYLHSVAGANGVQGDGLLSPVGPGQEVIQGAAPFDRYVFDPENPVPTTGGNHSVGWYNAGLYEICKPGPLEQSPVERREDVLVYTTPVLERDTEVTGPVVLKLFASTTAVDTDWVARLADVHPDGRSFNVTEGVIRARYREMKWDQPTLLEPGVVYEYTIELLPTSMVFKAGHRIRLHVTSSNFPLWDRNLNTAEVPHMGTFAQAATQTVHHSREYASCLILPLI